MFARNSIYFDIIVNFAIINVKIRILFRTLVNFFFKLKFRNFEYFTNIFIVYIVLLVCIIDYIVW